MRYRFGLKELFFVIFGAGLTALLGNIDIGFTVNSCRVIQLELIIPAFFAFISGPVVGGLIGFIGYVLTRLLSAQEYLWGLAAADMTMGIGIGMFAASFEAYKGEFTGKKIGLFNVIQTISNAFAFMLVYPLSEILLHQVSVQTALRIGIAMFICNTVIIGVVVSILGIIYSTFIHIRLRNVKKQKEK